MKNIYSLLILICCAQWSFAQSGCPSVNAGPDVTLNCNQTSTTLNASVVANGTTASYAVTAIPYAPPYAYNTGTLINVGTDDIWSALITLPFNFCFYNNNYSQIVVGSNGLISFNTAYAGAFCPWSFTASCPSASLPLNSIYGPYHDYYPTSVGNIRYALLGAYPCRTFVVNYDHIPEFSCTTQISTSQIVIYESTNIIEVYILNKALCSTWNSGNAIIGIENASGTAGLAAPGRNTGSWSAANEAWRFTPTGPSNVVVNWLQGINTIGTGTSISVSPTTTTTYTAEAVYTCCNGNVVTVTDNVVVTPNLSYSLSVTPTHPTFCQGGSVTLTASGSSTNYTWTPSTGLNTTSGPTVIASPTVSTNYVVTGSNGVCTGTDTVFVTVSPHPVITATGSTICTGNSGTVTASSSVTGTTYVWSPSGSTSNPLTVSPTATTSYKVIGTAAGCKDSTTATVTVNPLPLIHVDNDTICNGFTAQLTAQNGVSYIWEDSSTVNPRNISPIITSTYYVTGTDANGCKNKDTAMVIVNNNPTITVNPVTICAGATTSLTASGALTYVWNTTATTNPLVITPPATAIYSVTGTDQNGCVGTDTALVTILPQPILTATGSTICLGDTGTVTAFSNTPGTTYIWVPTGDTANPISVNPITTSNYTVIGTASGCLDTTSATVIVNPLPAISVNDDAICEGFTAQITAANGVTYVWEDFTTINPRNVNPTITSTYYVTGTDANGCVNVDSATVVVHPNPVVIVDPESICIGGTASLMASGANTYNWSTNATSNPLVVSSSATTIYYVTGTDLNGCIGTDSALLSVYPKPVASFQPNPTVTTTDNPTVSFYNSSTGGSSWLWDFGDLNSPENTSFEISPSHTFSSYGYFPVWLIVESDFGCKDSTVRNVTVENPFTVYIPNAFSPNNIGGNEIFLPTGVGIDVNSYEMVIYDRWGELVFKTTNLFEGWNGRKNNTGIELTPGVYVYLINLRQIAGLKHSYTGHVTLIH